jgi:hypothetical protein
LFDPLSLINRKVFLLNRLDDIVIVSKAEDKTRVDIFSSPSGESQLDPIQIFDFYFVLKIDTKHNRFLISRDANISPLNVDKIVGWVDNRRCTRWDTRICLEPNYEKEAFAERKGNKNLQLKIFDTDERARDFLNSSSVTGGIIFDNDPVTFPPSKMSKTNPFRYPGQVIRPPMLELLHGGIFKTGLIGSIKIKREAGDAYFAAEIPEREYSSIKGAVDKAAQKEKNVNVFFLIEGTDSIYAFQKSIVKAMESINSDLSKNIPNMKYGALVYRDIPEGDKITEYVKLSKDFNKVKDFVANAQLQSVADRDDYVAYYYGLSQALRLGGFNKDELNVIIIIGAHGDYRADAVRKEAARKDSHASFIENTEKLFENLSDLGAHLYAVQLRNDDDKASEFFAKNIQKTMLEAVKYGYNNKYGNKSNQETKDLLADLSKRGISPTEPEMESPPYSRRYSVTRSYLSWKISCTY